MRKPLLVLATLQAGLIAVTAATFESDILPIFQSKCARCHMDGEDKGGLQLDPDQISNHIRSSKQINPGDSSRSLLIRMVTTEDPDDRMPPRGAPLSVEQINLLKEWIDSGAELGGMAPAGAEAAEVVMEEKVEPLSGTFTNKDGVAITAAILRVESGTAVLRRADGREFEYPVMNFSPESQATIKEWLEGGAAE